METQDGAPSEHRYSVRYAFVQRSTIQNVTFETSGKALLVSHSKSCPLALICLGHLRHGICCSAFAK